MWWCTSLIPVLGGQRQVDLCGFEASLSTQQVQDSQGLGSVTQRNTVSKTKNQNNNKTALWGQQDKLSWWRCRCPPWPLTFNPQDLPVIRKRSYTVLCAYVHRDTQKFSREEGKKPCSPPPFYTSCPPEHQTCYHDGRTLCPDNNYLPNNGPKGKSNNAKGRSLGTCKKAECLQILGSSTVHTGRCYNACSVDINLECTLRNSGDYCIWNICLHKPHTLQNVPEFYEMSPTIRKRRCESAPGLQAKTPWLIIHSSGHPEHQY